MQLEEDYKVEGYSLSQSCPYIKGLNRFLKKNPNTEQVEVIFVFMSNKSKFLLCSPKNFCSGKSIKPVLP